MPSLHDWLPEFTDRLMANCECTHITCDSRLVSSGTVFLACPGGTVDGRDFVSDAIARGAVAVVYESPWSELDDHPALPVPLVPVPQLSRQLGVLASRFYQAPSAQLNTVAVTGTDGKTSCVDLLAQASAHQQRCGVLGTLGVGLWPDYQLTGMTTVDAVSMHRCCHALQQQQAEALVLEASSHGLVQGRLDEMVIDIAVFTSFSRDHLDFHGSMDAYKNAKKRLFSRKELQWAIVNADDDAASAMLSAAHDDVQCIGVSLKPDTVMTSCRMVNLMGHESHLDGTILDVKTPWGEGRFHLALFGEFNVTNALLVMAVLGVWGWTFEQIQSACQALKPVIGRMQCLGEIGQPTVMVDYAHTPKALERALKSLRPHCDGKLWCVFGCGGDRDRGKRPLMAAVASRYADHVVITTDNPRTEDPEQIIMEMMAGLDDGDPVTIQRDREQAIAFAVQSAAKNDMVLVAGKGHEAVQVIGSESIPFSDVVISQQQLTLRAR